VDFVIKKLLEDNILNDSSKPRVVESIVEDNISE
jgi:hypothetical protein